jgi:steroid 5-alpha reductase family enzyme
MDANFVTSLMDAYRWGLAGAALVMVVAGTIAVAKRDNGTVDVFWGPMIATIATFGTVGPASEVSGISWIVLILVWVWAIRLALHIGLRQRGSKGEDFRYAEWRRQWGRWWLVRSIGQVFVLQAALATVVSSPILVIAASSQPEGPGWILVAIGAGVWAVGFVLEVVADAQITRFVARKKAGLEHARMCTTGVWGISRHPNYLGEAVAWWGIGLIAFAVPYGWLGLIGPLVITYLLRFVSGVPMLEAAWRDRDGFAEWSRRTPVFLPKPFGRTAD